MSIKVYAKPGCIFCNKLDNLMIQFSIPYTKYELSSQKEIDEIKNISKMSTFPMVFIGTECVGGYMDFLNLVMTNTLEEKLKANNINDINIPLLF